VDSGLGTPGDDGPTGPSFDGRSLWYSWVGYPAKISAHIQKRIEKLPKIAQDIGWKAQVRLCKRYRRLIARGKHANIVTTAIARELLAFMWAIAKEVPITA
jgi:transposase